MKLETYYTYSCLLKRYLKGFKIKIYFFYYIYIKIQDYGKRGMCQVTRKRISRLMFFKKLICQFDKRKFRVETELLEVELQRKT